MLKNIDFEFGILIFNVDFSFELNRNTKVDKLNALYNTHNTITCFLLF